MNAAKPAPVLVEKFPELESRIDRAHQSVLAGRPLVEAEELLLQALAEVQRELRHPALEVVPPINIVWWARKRGGTLAHAFHSDEHGTYATALCKLSRPTSPEGIAADGDWGPSEKKRCMTCDGDRGGKR